MLRATFLIDGFNLYHSALQANKDLGLHGYGTRWLDFRSLFRSYLPTVRAFVGSPVDIQDIYYFSALATHLEPGKVERHENYIKCLRNSQIKVELGRFKPKQVWCSSCRVSTRHWEEKESDVAMSIRLAEVSLGNKCDVTILVTGDTDMAPAVRMVHAIAPSVKIGFGFPYKRKNKELANIADFSFNMSKEIYQSHQFSNIVVLHDGTRVTKPASW